VIIASYAAFTSTTSQAAAPRCAEARRANDTKHGIFVNQTDRSAAETLRISLTVCLSVCQSARRRSDVSAPPAGCDALAYLSLLYSGGYVDCIADHR